MSLFKKNLAGNTYIRYFLSYLIILTVLIIGFFFIIRKQFTRSYFEQLCNQAKTQLDSIATQLNDDLVYLSQTDSSLKSNIQLIMSRHQVKGYQNYQTYRELKKYDSSSKLINSISYMVKNSTDVIYTKSAVTYEESGFRIWDENGYSMRFDPTPYFDADSGQLLFLSGDTMQHLIYFPPISSNANYIFFYILDETSIQQSMQSLISDGISAIALVDANNQIAVGVNASQLLPYMDFFELENGIYGVDSSTSICVHTGIRNGFSMISLISNDSLLRQIDDTFASSYIALLLLASLGFFLVFLAMRITYLPLHQLTRKLVSGFSSNQGYLKQLEDAFTEAEDQNQLLKDKLEDLRLSVQKSLLDAVIASGQSDCPATLPNIEQFFDTKSNKEIFTVLMSSPDGELPYLSIQQYFQEVLPGNDSCIILNAEKDNALFLINYIGLESNKDEVLKELLINFNEEKGYLSALSYGSGSPLDIPSLCESVKYASSFWPQVSVAEYKSLPPASTSYAYPYDKLELMSELLKKNTFSDAKLLLDDIFQVVCQSNATENPVPDFFVRSILVDVLTIISNCMSQCGIAFNSYSDLYYETLYACRSCPYSEKAEEIAVNTHKLLDFYEQEVSNKILNPEHLKQIIEASYCQPDFSISVLADKFQVSIAYTSRIIKKELGQNFSDYLWALRLEKAKDLLKNTDMSIDEISNSVGYLNTSSFRRKFNQETGITPSQFRSEYARPVG
ncbi:MAG: helix-turn-helix transcriptional regulator [Lachnospiraceae bacterium]|nr:helix-turn-helix transcriptional regulator [Lachnospiraceae bacterium]